MSLEPNAKKPRIATDSDENEIENISDMVVGVLSEEPLLQLEATTKFRKFLSSNVTSNVDEVIQYGVVPRFVEFLKKEDSPKIQYEAAWIITNLACGNGDVLIDHGAVPNLVQLLSSPNKDVLEKAIFALGNVACGSTRNRDLVLSCDVFLPLLPHLNVNTKLSTLRIATWTLANLCRGQPSPPFNQVKPALPTLKRLLQSDDEELLSDACSALWYMSNGSDEGIQSVIDAGFVPILVQLFQHTSTRVLTPICHIISAIICIDKQQIQIIDGVFSEEPLLQLESSTMLRKLLASVGTRPSESLVLLLVIQSGVVPRLIEFLKKEDSPKIQYEAAWIIKNIAAANPDVVIDHGAVPNLVQLLSSPNEDVLEQAICALGNVASGSTRNRDHVLSCDVLLSLLPHLNVNTKLSMLRIATWTLVNLCRGQPSPPFNQMKRALPKLERLLHSNDEQVLPNACSAVWHMSNGSANGIQSVIDAGFVPILVQLFQHTSTCVLTPVCHIISAIICIDKQQIQGVIDGGVLPILANMLTQVCEKSIKEACWIITNITAGTEEQIQSVIDANLIPILVNVAQTAEMNIKMEAVWAISFASSGGSDAQVNCIKPLCDLLVCEDLRVVLECLNGLENILKVGEADMYGGDYRQLISDAEGQAKIENLKSHHHNQIKDKAVKILEFYWPGEEDEKAQQPPK